MRRRTNVGLLCLLVAAFLTGWIAFGFATATARWSLAIHAVAGFAILALIPWKSAISRRGVANRRPGWWASLVLGLLVLVSILAGLAHSTGLLRWGWDLTAMEFHVGAAIAAVPFALWHVPARPVRLRTTDLGRRHVLRAATVVAAATAGYAASEAAVRVTGLPGVARRFTGSYEVGSLRPDLLPVTQWMFDTVPTLGAPEWRLSVHAPGHRREWTYAELAGFGARFRDGVRATLDCTGGFYSEQDWAGVWLSRLLPEGVQAVSVRIVSHTGYDRRFPIEEAPRLLLATRVGGRELDPGHGHPVRLVAPGRRGFAWVKWVTAIHLDDAPDWWQLPFPLQ